MVVEFTTSTSGRLGTPHSSMGETMVPLVPTASYNTDIVFTTPFIEHSSTDIMLSIVVNGDEVMGLYLNDQLLDVSI